MVDTLVETYELLNMDVNVARTELLITRYDALTRLPNPTISRVGDSIEEGRVCRLGTTVSSSSDLGAKINQRIQSAAAAVFKLNRGVTTTKVV